MKPKVTAITLNPPWDILSGILRKHGVNTLSEFILHINPKKFHCQREKIIYVYDQCLVSETCMLGCKISPIRDPKLKHLIGFKIHYNLRM